ncbi:MAG: NTP transferase domain-containing protein [Candidatus Omnitrophica bacterium]|nr:NTP transferase domain-containing protein [Candidatus Omnitrophota bacterium]
MTAIILAAGVGKRMGPGAGPKCLLSLGGKTLLQRTFESLRSAGVNRLVLVTGYRKEEVAAEARRRAGSTALTLLVNPRCTEGAILSLWTAREALADDDVLILDADVLCPPAAFERLIRSAHPNCLLVDGTAADTGEEQMVLGKEGRALFITKRPSPELKSRLTSLGESVGFLKLGPEGARFLRSFLEKKVETGQVNLEHEQVYPALFERVPVGFERMDGLAWTEIDTPEELSRAQQEILPSWSGPGEECVNRRLAKLFLPAILPLPLSPNAWTFLSLVSGLTSVAWMARGNGAWAACFFQLFYLIDFWDGEVARTKGLSSKWGGWFDVTVDALVHTLMPPALALGLWRGGAPDWVWVLGLLAAFGILFDFLVTMRAKARGFGPAVHGDSSGRLASGETALRRFVRVNGTGENFSWLVAAVLALGLELPFLAAMAAGTQFYWILFLWRERRRL